MPKVKISEYSATANSNTDVASINIDEGCAPSGINNAIRAIMGHLKDFQSGTSNDPFTVGSSGSLTLSYGTANGVAYLNGSKVLTTGSALVFDGTNLGVGVTPNANWSTAFKALDIGFTGNSLVGFSASDVGILSGCYYQGGGSAGWKWSTTNSLGASYYEQYNGASIWNISAPTAHTAGNTVTFTQAMTLGANGNLLLGATSDIGAISGTNLVINSTAANKISFGISGTAKSYIYADSGQLAIGHPSGGTLDFQNAGGGTPMRLDSSGTLLVGCTGGGASGYAIVSYGSGGDIQRIFSTQASSASYTLISMFSSATTPSAPTGTLRVNITTNGGIANYQANDSNISDRREKTNFAPATSYLDKICAIPVQTFNYIDQNLEEDGGLTLGVVAQDVQAVAPELVTESNWGTQEEPKMRLSIYQTDLQYALMKCIQEQQALIQTLTARITALESA